MPIDAHNVLCAQLTRDLLVIAKFLLSFVVMCVQWQIQKFRLRVKACLSPAQ